MSRWGIEGVAHSALIGDQAPEGAELPSQVMHMDAHMAALAVPLAPYGHHEIFRGNHHAVTAGQAEKYVALDGGQPERGPIDRDSPSREVDRQLAIVSRDAQGIRDPAGHAPPLICPACRDLLACRYTSCLSGPPDVTQPRPA